MATFPGATTARGRSEEKESCRGQRWDFSMPVFILQVSSYSSPLYQICAVKPQQRRCRHFYSPGKSVESRYCSAAPNIIIRFDG